MTKNEYVDELNQKLILQCPGEPNAFNSLDEAVDDYQEEFLKLTDTEWFTSTHTNFEIKLSNNIINKI